MKRLFKKIARKHLTCQVCFLHVSNNKTRTFYEVFYKGVSLCINRTYNDTPIVGVIIHANKKSKLYWKGI